MCWVALDRAIALADRLDAGDRVDRLEGQPATRSREADPHATGWSDEAGAFTQSFGSDDARRVEPDDADRRLPARRRPADAGHDRRHRRAPHRRARAGLPLPHQDGVDGLAGEEGTFLLCTFWLAQALALAGQVDRARAVFERAVAFVNDVGLLAEEVDPADRRAARQLPAGVQPHRPGQRRLGDRRGAASRHRVTSGSDLGRQRP